jgi:hypothetical protein
MFSYEKRAVWDAQPELRLRRFRLSKVNPSTSEQPDTGQKIQTQFADDDAKEDNRALSREHIVVEQAIRTM